MALVVLAFYWGVLTILSFARLAGIALTGPDCEGRSIRYRGFC
ncbi:MAG TPA: hypothetical protein VHW09_06630 [Bryobacteraceae bacterium]|nr:hypothetical protein [Bryobacteraceae bacterium]